MKMINLFFITGFVIFISVNVFAQPEEDDDVEGVAVKVSLSKAVSDSEKNKKAIENPEKLSKVCKETKNESRETVKVQLSKSVSDSEKNKKSNEKPEKLSHAYKP